MLPLALTGHHWAQCAPEGLVVRDAEWGRHAPKNVVNGDAIVAVTTSCPLMLYSWLVAMRKECGRELHQQHLRFFAFFQLARGNIGYKGSRGLTYHSSSLIPSLLDVLIMLKGVRLAISSILQVSPRYSSCSIDRCIKVGIRGIGNYWTRRPRRAVRPGG